jgi:hypothetical protein
MAKSDLLKEAIADAKAVKETALANAKIALQEAFAPRLERMLATKLTNEIEGDEEEMPVEEPIDANPEMGDEMGAEAGAGNDVGDLSIDVDGDGEFDEFDIYSQESGEEMPEEEPVMGDEEMTDEYNEGYEDDLNLESIIRELEGDLEGEDANLEDGLAMEGDYMGHEEMPEEDDLSMESIDEILEAILREEDEMGEEEKEPKMKMEGEDHEKEEMKEELEEAYATVKKLQGILSEVNLLNAKLLYTNKLFRNFELSENQKMKVIENFDRAGNTREVKLVFTTLAESFNRPTKKRVVKESYASKASASTAPSKETTQVLSEGFELANRWKKLAGLL